MGINASQVTKSDTETDTDTMSQRRRAEWTERVDYFAREAAPRTQPFAEGLVELAPPPRGGRVLDVATGSGIVAVEAAKIVGPAGTVLATDFVPEWGPHVAATAADAGVTNVRFATMPAEALDLPDASFDAVYCQFGLMFMPEPLDALREMRRVLRPEGRLGVAVWSVPEKVGLVLMSRILATALPPPPGEPPPSPTSMGEPGLIEGLVAAAGFRDVVVERLTHAFATEEPETAWRQWSENTDNPATRGLASLSVADRDRVRGEVIAALEVYRIGDGVSVPSEAILVTAVR